jgi:hypothetical protein
MLVEDVLLKYVLFLCYINCVDNTASKTRMIMCAEMRRMVKDMAWSVLWYCTNACLVCLRKYHKKPQLG